MTRSLCALLALAAFAASCGDSATPTTSSAAATPAPSPAGAASPLPAPSPSPAAAPVTSAATGSCGGARVLIAFFSDAACTAQVGQRTYDTSQTCFTWTAAGSNAGENSATRFQCYRDRLCYTQHPNTLTCGQGGFGWTDKQARLGQCLKEPDGLLYSKLISGSEGCPEAPVGFECPLSASSQGTDGIVACTTR